MTPVVSPSELNLFYQCPKRWYWLSEGIEGLKIEHPEAEFGKKIHFIIYLYFTRLQGKPKSVDEIKALVNRVSVEVGSDQQTRKILNNFIKFEAERLNTWEEYLPKFVEQRIEITDHLSGIIDFYGNNTIIDWKTGKFLYLKLDDIRQGNIYRYLLEKAGYQVNRILFVYLRDNKVIEIPKKLEPEIEEEINRMKRMIETGYLPKNKGVHCSWCEYQIRCEFDEEGVTLWSL